MKHLYMIAFTDSDSIEDDGFCYNHALFIAAMNERSARRLAVLNDPTLYGVLDADYPLTVIDLGATDRRLLSDTEEWNVIPDGAWPAVEAYLESIGLVESETP